MLTFCEGIDHIDTEWFNVAAGMFSFGYFLKEKQGFWRKRALYVRFLLLLFYLINVGLPHEKSECYRGMHPIEKKHKDRIDERNADSGRADTAVAGIGGLGSYARDDGTLAFHCLFG